MPEIEERFRSLEQSNKVLAGDVQALTAALTALNDLRLQQREVAARTQRTEKAVEEVRTETVERARRTSTALKMTTAAMAILLPLVSILVYASLISHVNDLLAQNDVDRLRSCKVRNDAVQINIDRERLLAKVENDGPEAVAAHLDSASRLEQKLIDCDQLYSTAAKKG